MVTKARKVYVSGPMTGMPDLNFPAFNAAAQVLRDHGYEVANPVDINPDPRTHRHECMRRDLAELTTCDALCVLPGWERSHGARREVEDALACGMLIADLETFVLLASSMWASTRPLNRVLAQHQRTHDAANAAQQPGAPNAVSLREMDHHDPRN